MGQATEARAGVQAAPGAGWCSKAPAKRVRDRRAAAQREIDARVDASKLAWARRHPAAAAAERSLRKAQATTATRWKHKNEGTAETHEHAARRQQGALARLYLSGGIDAEQLAAAAEIAAVAERIGGDVAVKTASLETRVDTTRMGDGTFFERLGQVRREVAYTRWRAAVGAGIAPVLDMIVGDAEGFTVVARRYRMGNRRAKALLIAALDLWPRILGGVVREVDEATLAAAQAGIL
ncbi:MAG TPA: hypothetical protein VF680_11600 [Allosphingosinicella sp.]|jgi:hypothetical protein